MGDEDQSLYRFRGATVRNILEFPARFAACEVIKLTTNYRSHNAIVERYDRWTPSIDWLNPHGVPFRFDKQIEADPDVDHPDYPAVMSIRGQNATDEAGRFADLVEFLKANRVIENRLRCFCTASDSAVQAFKTRIVTRISARQPGSPPPPARLE